MGQRAGLARLATRDAFEKYVKANEMLPIFEMTSINVWRTDGGRAGRGRLARRNAFDYYSKAKEKLALFEIKHKVVSTK